MKQFLYKTIEFNGAETISNEQLANLGYEGWELIIIEQTEFGSRFYFKKEAD